MNTDSVLGSTYEECNGDPSIRFLSSLRFCSYRLRLNQVYLIQSTVNCGAKKYADGKCHTAKIQALHCSIKDRSRLIFQIYNSPEIQMETRRLSL